MSDHSSLLNRRSFLATTTGAGAALVIGFYLPARAFADEAAEQEAQPPNPFNAWVRITKDNRVTLILAKSEMGQGVMTALPMILAEELCVDWKSVTVEQAPTNPDIYEHGTGGSSSVPESWLPLRRAGAAARQMLLVAAAKRWNVNEDTCKAENGAVIHGARKKLFTYGELVEEAAALPLPDFKKVPLKNSNDFTIVGHDTRRFEARGKVNGTAGFGLDARTPGMLFAVVARCPVFGGKPASYDAAKAQAVPGVRSVLAIEAIGEGAFTAGGVAVVAENSWAAIEGRKALQIKWEEGPAAEESSESLRRQCLENAAKPGKTVRNEGDAEAALAAAGEHAVKADYQVPFAAHACMEPMNCTVHIGPASAEAWVPSQAPQWAREAIAKIAGLKPETVNVHTTLMGGGFGRRYQADFAAEAAQISKATGGKPIQLLWTREDDLQHCFYRPFSVHRMAGALDGKGNLAAWKHFQTSTSIAAAWEKDGAEKPEQSEFGMAAFLPYLTPNYRVEYSLARSAVPRAWWRSVENSGGGFVVESFVDELAAAAKADPLEFRLRLLGDDRSVKDAMSPTGDPVSTARLKGVLKLAAEKAGWGGGKPAAKGMGLGIACYFSFNSYAAMVVEAGLKNGEIHVARIVAAVDVGRAINPQGVRAQVESAAIYGLTAALKDSITIRAGRVEQSNFHDYQMLRLPEAPPVEVHIVASTEKPTGIGEPAVPVLAPALCNALFAATGKRARTLPLRAADFA
ncbi:MAG: xanthine dehydrogenase family protein molybdopterin-binding subunit [Acidobacteriia bacterium]|nr:xanthine dehydrogenase family protein molybdopterin-binding subunit [Terriglobia bacterium]